MNIIFFLLPFLSSSSLHALDALLYQHATILFVYCFTTLFVACISFFFLKHYQDDAKKDCKTILLVSFCTAILFQFVLQENILSAAAIGVFSGELLGMLIARRFSPLKSAL